LAVKGHLVKEPNLWKIHAILVADFFTNLKETTGKDFTEVEHFDEYLNFMEFDQVTSINIKKEIGVMIETSKMLKEGKSEKEIMDFLKKKNAEGIQ
jgi:hypothetical protein